VTAPPADAAPPPDVELAGSPPDAAPVVAPTAVKPIRKTRVRPPEPAKRPAAKRTDPDEIIR
jgi:hypothetical protein